jgi:two-component system LytT family response regulator
VVILAPPSPAAALRRAFAARGFTVVGEANEEPAALDQAHRARADVLAVHARALGTPPLAGLRAAPFSDPVTRPAVVVAAETEEAAATAVAAGAAAFLVAPFTAERVVAASEQIHEAVRLRQLGRAGRRFTARTDEPAHPPRFAITFRGELRIVPVEDVDYVSASDSYALVHTDGEALPLRASLGDLERRLDPAQFCRIHRSTIVRLDRVERLLTASGGDYALRLRDGTELSVARGRRDELVRRLGAYPA